jgi:hypothetical protein
VIDDGTPGNHDLLPALEKITAVKYLIGESTEQNGLRIAGIPATGEGVALPVQFFPECYAHLQAYNPVFSDNEEPENKGLAQQLLEEQEPLDILITHKSPLVSLQNKDPYYAKLAGTDCDFGVDGSAAAILRKRKPKINAYGYYHLEKARVNKLSGKYFVFVGPNAAVTITWEKESGTEPEFTAHNYS